MDFTSLETTQTTTLPIHDYPFHNHTTTFTETTTILALPTEILLRVAYLLTLPPYPNNPNPQSKPSSKNTTYTPTLKSLRLAHPALSPLSIPYLFSHLTLPLWGPHGLYRLHNVASAPHIATSVQHMKLWVQFNVAEPHPAPFQEGNLRRGSADLLSVRDPPPRKKDVWKRRVSGAVERRMSGLSLGRKKSKGVDEGRNASVVSNASLDGTATAIDTLSELQRQNTLPDYNTSPKEFLQTFDKMASTTVSRNLATAELSVAAERDMGPSPMLKAMVKFMTRVFGGLERLQTLCVDCQTQEEFMERLDRGFALRPALNLRSLLMVQQYAPTQDTWEAICGYVIGMIIAGWIRSSASRVRRLWMLGGAVFWGDILMKEYLSRSEQTSGVSWKQNGLGDVNEEDERNGLELWKEKAANLESLSLKFDVGAYRKNFDAIETQWFEIVRSLIKDMPKLQYLELGRQKRADGSPSDQNPGGLVKLSRIAAEGREDGQSLANLKLLRLVDMAATSVADFKQCLEALGGLELERLVLGNFDLHAGDWVSAWKMLRTDCQFKLKQMLITGTKYADGHGFWATGKGQGQLQEVQAYVEGKTESNVFFLPSVEGAGEAETIKEWKKLGDETLKYSSR